MAGLEETIAVERKTLDDFVGTVMLARGRFYRELRRLQRYTRACVVVEANLSDAMAGRYRCDAHPNAILGSALAIAVDFGIPIYFCSSRQVACRFVEGYVLRAAERRQHWHARLPDRIRFPRQHTAATLRQINEVLRQFCRCADSSISFSMRLNGQPSWPKAMTWCRFSSLKTLLTSMEGIPHRCQCPVSVPLAGFQPSLIGRF